MVYGVCNSNWVEIFGDSYGCGIDYVFLGFVCDGKFEWIGNGGNEG